MAHDLDMSNDRANMAYVGEAPWHGLGQELPQGASLDVWAQNAGLDFKVSRLPACYHMNDKTLFTGKHVLYREDTEAPLGIVDPTYKIVQPKEILWAFEELVAKHGTHIETAGSLAGGKRVWALAQLGDQVNIIGNDAVRPYLLMSTGFDGVATVAKRTAIRVVCRNTITMALGWGEGEEGKIEQDVTGRAVNTLVRVKHRSVFDPKKVLMELGIATTAWDKWVIQTRVMAEKAMDEAAADAFLLKLLPNPEKKEADKVRDSKNYKAIMELFNGSAIGADLTQGPTAWAMLNAVTEQVDHHMGRSSNNRMMSAWFGDGEILKRKAYALLAA